MKYLLDTNVCVEVIRDPRGKLAGKVLATPKAEIGISVVTAGELLAGSNRKKSLPRQSALCAQLVGLFQWIPFGVEEARVFGRIGAGLMDIGKNIGNLDLQIAATALQRSLIVVTHNVQEFSRVPSLDIEDWQAQVGADL